MSITSDKVAKSLKSMEGIGWSGASDLNPADFAHSVKIIQAGEDIQHFNNNEWQ